MKPARKKTKPSASFIRKTQSKKAPRGIRVDYPSICSVDFECSGQAEVSKSCCAKFDVTVSETELNRIIPVLPDAAQLCPHLKTDDGYANVFEESEKGVYSIDTHENGLCVFAYVGQGLIRCSLHTVEKQLGLSPGSVKPEVCLLFPLTFSGAGNVLTLHDQALTCECCSIRKKASNRVSPELLETIGHYCQVTPGQTELGTSQK